MPIPWNADPPGYADLIARNVASCAFEIARDAPTRPSPAVSTAIDWHRAIFRDVPLPVPYHAGGIRDTNPAEPGLVGYGCRVGHLRSAHSSEVPQRLALFEQALARSVSALDAVVAAGDPPTRTHQLRAIVDLSAIAHGEWIRIHPFANGNGRVARLWVRFILLRYRLPSILPVHPRPDVATYAGCARLAMLGQDRPTAAFFHTLIRDAL